MDRIKWLRARHAAAVARKDAKWIKIYARASLRAVIRGRDWAKVGG